MSSDDWNGSKIGRLRRQLLERDGLVCWLCGQPIIGETATVDHVLPRSLGGSHELSNLRLAHAACNRNRGAKTGGPANLGDLAWLPAPRL